MKYKHLHQPYYFDDDIGANDFQKFAISQGISSNTLHGYQKHTNGLISPTIIEERQLNAVTMDVFSRLMGDRIIFLGTAVLTVLHVGFMIMRKGLKAMAAVR